MEEANVYSAKTEKKLSSYYLSLWISLLSLSIYKNLCVGH